MKVDPYVSVGPMHFGVSTQADCKAAFGSPVQSTANRLGVQEFHFPQFIMRFAAETGTFTECTLLPYTTASIKGIELTWDRAFLASACEVDPSPMNVLGFIVFPKLGIAATGIHDDDKSQLAVTIFQSQAFDELLRRGTPYKLN